ncbi:type IV conjugative transfer system protein TraV [Salmonella enterica subsp. enterica serovar Muenchen]|nr:type IV conjugative transfer system protein TraV [Salmonella enterica subsp. enterica serovar Muenchen]
MKRITLLLAGCVLLLSGCAGVKSSFDCDATTSDTCMTMTKANQLARDKAAKQAAKQAGKQAAGGLPSLVNLPPQAASQPVQVRSVNRSASTIPPGTPSQTGGAPATVTAAATASRPVLTTPPAPAVTPVSAPAPSCQSVRCDSPGSVHPQRSQDRIATVWIAPWVDSDNAFHQPGRVSFVVSPADWVLPSRVN